MSTTISVHTLQAMKAYYQARADEYDECYSRQGRYDRALKGMHAGLLNWMRCSPRWMPFTWKERCSSLLLGRGPGRSAWPAQLRRSQLSMPPPRCWQSTAPKSPVLASRAHLMLIVAKIDAACSSFFCEERRKKSNRMCLLESPSAEAASSSLSERSRCSSSVMVYWEA
jgi:hypothetical protein